MQREDLSALMDGEVTDDRLISSLSHSRAFRADWQRYHIIRDVLRGEVGEKLHLDVADRVAAALELELGYSTANITESQPSPQSWQMLPFWHRLRGWSGQLAQVGVAAGVCLAVIMGVQQYSGVEYAGETGVDAPVLTTLPIGGQIAPVSYGVPEEISAYQLQQLQAQRQRINTMLQDYELQQRLQAEQPADDAYPLDDSTP